MGIGAAVKTKRPTNLLAFLFTESKSLDLLESNLKIWTPSFVNLRIEHELTLLKNPALINKNRVFIKLTANYCDLGTLEDKSGNLGNFEKSTTWASAGGVKVNLAASTAASIPNSPLITIKPLISSPSRLRLISKR